MAQNTFSLAPYIHAEHASKNLPQLTNNYAWDCLILSNIIDTANTHDTIAIETCAGNSFHMFKYHACSFESVYLLEMAMCP